VTGLADVQRWLYRGGRPNRLAKFLNGAGVLWSGLGIVPRSATLEVRGRRTGRTIRFPMVCAEQDGEQYLVSMLGPDANWVLNVQAAGGNAVLKQGRRRPVRLEPVPVERRPAILTDYLAHAPGARPHLPIHRDMPAEQFARAAAQVPVFHVVQRPGDTSP